MEGEGHGGHLATRGVQQVVERRGHQDDDGRDPERLGEDDRAGVAAVLARKARKPVKLINTREEEFLAGCRPRVFMKINVKMGFKRSGTPRRWAMSGASRRR